MDSGNRRRRPVATRVTEAQEFGLPPSEHQIWTLGIIHVRIAVALVDMFATFAKMSSQNEAQ